jgi:type I restriction enzyme S subunit
MPSTLTNLAMDELMLFNPPESIKKGTAAKKIPMDRLGTSQRKINGYETAIYSAGPKFRNGNTLLAKITPCLENGKTAFVDILNAGEVAFGSSEFIVIRAIDGISNSRFNYYLARSPAFRDKAIKCMEGTSGRKRVNENELKKQILPIPDLESQKSIAEILSALDDKIELNARVNSELEAMARSLYDYWFVQFDFPDENKRPYKSAGGEMVFNASLNRHIPKGWEVLSLEKRLNFDRGTEFGADVYIESPKDTTNLVKFYRVGDMDNTGNNYIPADLPNIPMLKSGDLAVSFDGSVGRIAFGLNGSYSSGIRKIYDKQGIISSATLLFIFRNDFIQGTIKQYASGSNILHASAAIPHLLIPFVSSVYAKFQEQAEPIYQQLLENKAESARLAALRDFLLPMLMNGQVCVAA